MNEFWPELTIFYNFLTKLYFFICLFYSMHWQLILVLNLACSIIWLVGIGRVSGSLIQIKLKKIFSCTHEFVLCNFFLFLQKRSSLMLVSLFWWAVPLSLWIGFIFFVLFKGVCDYFEDKKPHLRDYNLIYPVTGIEGNQSLLFIRFKVYLNKPTTENFEWFLMNIFFFCSIFHCILFLRCDEL